MPPRSKVELLPQDVRDELDKRLRESGYGELVALSHWLKETHGMFIGKSALGQYSSGLKAKDKAATMIAKDMREDLSDRETVDLLLELGALRVKEHRILRRLEEIGYI
ncbi:phage protein Gp27 family protein [Metapseudomonas otitidis]|uniref:phage protein Gp27 family protein n=1 Tax=Metapseudomonas otitidis TaxID=319939 RepID=UPI0013F67991|nr:phage protein Gp27 family protein [Pseudomonas otitidis]